MKKIGISLKLETSKNGVNFQIDKNWFDYFSKFNANLIPIGFNKFNNFKIEKLNLDGIIISGGGNIFNLEKKKNNFLRDEFETKIIRKFQRENKPILLVCRGFQLLASNYGTQLIKVKDHVKSMHKIYLSKNVFFNKKQTLFINSFHNYGIKKIGNEFEVLGKTKNGSIEFAKVKKQKTYCIMFHPERHNKDQISVNKIIRRIFSI